jgi:hypothetical protein
MFASTKLHKIIEKNTFFANNSIRVDLIPIFNISEYPDLQTLAKMLQKHPKKNHKKIIVVLKKYITLHRFN